MFFAEPPLPETHKNQNKKASRKGRLRRRNGGEPEPCPTGLYLGSVDGYINVSDALDRPMFGVLMSEDFCWRATVSEWQARRPSRRPFGGNRAERAGWRAEGQELAEKRARIRELAAELGVVGPEG